MRDVRPSRTLRGLLTPAREEMFARAYLLKTRVDGPDSPDESDCPSPDPDSGLKSDVEQVSSEGEARENEREDPNEYLQDLPAEVRFCPHNELVVQVLGTTGLHRWLLKPGCNGLWHWQGLLRLGFIIAPHLLT